jgi:2-amino-4-hydroxy-6-hydroxymethyldihydropteridine diphosphokinase
MNCGKGIELVVKCESIRVLEKSPFYETEPVGVKDQQWFINGVLKISTLMAPEKLLKTLKDIECQVGRTPQGLRFGPRVLDLDILLYGEAIMDFPDLIIPHPRMHQRRFVLQPMCDLAPDMRHPVSGKTMRDLLGRLDDADQKVMPI